MTNPFDAVIEFIRRRRPTNPSRFIVPYMLVILTVLLLINLADLRATRDFAHDLRDGLVASCKRNGNPLRAAVRLGIAEQIERTRHTPHQLFPDIPLEQFRRLKRDSIEANRRQLDRLHPLDCEGLYP